MFYSHEILMSRQYGVATIWLVATVGTGAGRKITKKAIQDVNLRKACQKIQQPEAPLALRLQGNLLYGASRVLDHQCNYILHDASKVESDMKAVFGQILGNQIDPRAGKAKRHFITLEDDPNFDPLQNLPVLDFDLEGGLLLGTSQKLSNYSPIDGRAVSFSSDRSSTGLGFDFLDDQSAVNLQLDDPFATVGSSAQKSATHRDPFDDEFAPIGGFALNFDGEHIQVMESEPELPPLPGSDGLPVAQPAHGQLPGSHIRQSIEHDGGVLVMEDELPPDAEAFTPGSAIKARDGLALEESSELSSQEAVASAKHKPRVRKAPQLVDEVTTISQRVIRQWTEDYERNCGSEHKKARGGQARTNAFHLTYGFGVFNIGQPTAVPGLNHPLAKSFSGAGLQAALVLEVLDDPGQPRGEVRSSSEAFGEDEEGARRVRPRIEEEGGQVARGRLDSDGLPAIPDSDNLLPEMGMDAQAPMSDLHSSSMLPWLRSAQKQPGADQVSASPLVGRGSMIQDIERFSDAPGSADLGAGGLASIQSMDSPADMLSSPPKAAEAPSQEGFLDAQSKILLDHITNLAKTHGVARDDDSQDNWRWIEFDDLAKERVDKKGDAAQTFLLILSLTTRNMIRVKQDANAGNPFERIHIGVEVDISQRVGVEADSPSEKADHLEARDLSDGVDDPEADDLPDMAAEEDDGIEADDELTGESDLSTDSNISSDTINFED